MTKIAAILKKELSQAFPGVKFSVTTKKLSDNMSVNWELTIGTTATNQSVSEICKRYETLEHHGNVQNNTAWYLGFLVYINPASVQERKNWAVKATEACNFARTAWNEVNQRFEEADGREAFHAAKQYREYCDNGIASELLDKYGNEPDTKRYYYKELVKETQTKIQAEVLKVEPKTVKSELVELPKSSKLKQFESEIEIPQDKVLRAIVATATSETEANLIFAEIAKTHAFIEFFKIDSCQVTVVYEPDQSRFDRINREADERCASLTERPALPPIKKSADKLTVVDLEAKIKKLGLDKDLFIRVAIRNPDKPQKYIIHDLDWNFQKPATFESVSAIAVSRKLSKIHKKRQAVQVGHNLAIDTSQPIDIQKVCPHCDRPLGKDQICCGRSVPPTTAKQRQICIQKVREIEKEVPVSAKVTATTAKQRQGQSKQVKVKSSS